MVHTTGSPSWLLGPKCMGAEVLVQLAHQRATGQLVCRRGQHTLQITLTQGRPTSIAESTESSPGTDVFDRTQVVAHVRAFALAHMGNCTFTAGEPAPPVLGAPTDIDTLGETLVAVVSKLPTTQRDALWQARGRWHCALAPSFAQLNTAIASVTRTSPVTPPAPNTLLEQALVGLDERAQRNWAALVLLGGIVLSESPLEGSHAAATPSPSSKAASVPAATRTGTAPKHPLAVEVEAAHARMPTQDHYLFLGVERHAPAEVLRKAYFEKAKLWHTDRFAGTSLPVDVLKQAEELFHRGEEAYRVLNDPSTRASYDWMLQRQAAGLPTNPEIIVAAEKLFTRGQQMVRAGHLAKAEPILRQAVELNNGEPEFLAYWGYALYGARGASARQEAETMIHKALSMQAKLDVAHEFLGKIARMEGDWPEAQKCFAMALGINPRNYDVIREQRGLTARAQHINRPGAGGKGRGQKDKARGILGALQTWWQRWTAK